MKTKTWKAISLFAGAGGCSLGFCQAGIDIIAAYDNAESAIQTYNNNFPGDKCKKADLSSCNFDELRKNLKLKKGELDIIIGGPPCQGFTTAGNRFWADPRNKLVQNYANALEVFYPRWFMLENVEGILTTAKGEYVFECIKKMISLGYSVYLKKVYMQEYGIPQRRKRVIIIGNREGIKFSYPTPITKMSGRIYRSSSITLRDAIFDLEGEEIIAIDHVFKQENSVQQERISALKCGQSMKDLPEHLQHNSFKKRANRRVCDGVPTEKRGGAPSGLKRLAYDEPCLTITSAALSEFVHPAKNRTLTIRECARIQTFPDYFAFFGTESQKILQIGNAIPPAFAKLIAEQIIHCDKTNRKYEELPCLVEYEVTRANAMSPALVRTCEMLDHLKNSQCSQLTMEGIKMPITKQQREFYKTFSQHGSGSALVEIAPKDVILLIHIAFKDLYNESASWFIPEYNILAQTEFYSITPSQINALPEKSIEEAVYYLQLCGATNTDNIIYLYLKNLSELYRRRYKYYHILRTQPFPQTEQIGLRCLLEYGNCSDDLLFSWMCWRKLIYDIDNRSAQETGYLFEPILASCLGGESVSHRYSPVKRVDDNGNPTNEGRQIDCYISETREVYELKLRVTIAASGQGRFSEELSFPYEAHMAGFTPILIVFDSTPSALLDKLKAKYLEEGGAYAIGEDAWNMLTNRAGEEMGKFIVKYIKPPISKMEFANIGLPQDIQLSVTSEKLSIKDTQGNEYQIPRIAITE